MEFPSLLTPGPALLAAALAVPTLLLLYFLRLRRRVQPVASTLFWHRSLQDLQVNTPFQRLRRNLLLLLQAILLLGLLFALARPVSNQLSVEAGRHLVLLDRSASMSMEENGSNRLDLAKRRAIELIDSLPDGSSAAVIAFDDSAQIIQPITEDRRLLREAIERIQSTDRPTRLATAYTLADATSTSGESGNARPQVHLFSDGRALDAADVTLTGELRFYPVGSDQSANVGIAAFGVRRNYERPSEVQAFARLVNHGREPRRVDVVLSTQSLDDPAESRDFRQRGVRRTSTLLPAGWSDQQRRDFDAAGEPTGDSVEFTLDLVGATAIRLEVVSDQPDALETDNTAWAVVPASRQLSAVLVTEPEFFLTRALRAVGVQSLQVITPAQYAAAPPTDADLIIFNRVSPAVLPEAGRFIYFDGVPPASPLRPKTDAAGVAQVMSDVRVLDWKQDHPLVRGLDLSRVFAQRAMLLETPDTAEVIVDGLDGPLVTLWRERLRTHLVVAFDLQDSNWPLRDSFPYFIFNTIQFMSASADLSVGRVVAPGESVRLPTSAVERALAGREGPIELVAPDGVRRALRADAQTELSTPTFDRIGLYATEPAVPGYEWIAVSLLDENESNPAPATVAPGRSTAPVDLASSRSRREWWPWLLAAIVLPVLMLEWWIYTRRASV